jgi:hypothetical protein
VAALAWLIIPLAAALLAAVWAHWAGRDRIAGDSASLAEYERFRLAMETLAVREREAGTESPPHEQLAVEEDSPRMPVADEEDSPRGPVVGPVP